MFSYFTANQFYPLLVSTIIYIASIVFFHTAKKNTSLFLLLLGSLCLGYFIANLDHFLILWDEQLHALVAKNMMNDFLKPTLYADPLLEYDYKNSMVNSIWLHKQPLFLWQMALSMKFFGVNELSARIPSIILHAIATLMIYRMGKISYSSNVGYYGALFFSVAYYPLELVAGRYPTDHNDVAFLFYVAASFWAWFEYQNSQKKYWLIIIGLFSGCAVWVKWMVGLLVYSVWIISIGVNNKRDWFKWKLYLPIVYSIAIAFLVFTPWQMYTLLTYPQEAQYELALNTRHFFEPVDGHSGNIWYHFNAAKEIYGSGDAVPFLLLIGLFLLIRNATSNIYRVAIVSAIIITYGFYTLASTKMSSFCIIVSPFAFLGLGTLVDSIFGFLTKKIKLQKFDFIFRIISLFSVCFFLLNTSKIQNYHTDWKPHDNKDRHLELEQMKFIDKLKSTLPDEKYVVFNSSIRFAGYISTMFYTGCVAYDFIPTEKQIAVIKTKPYKIVILDTGSLPDFIKADNEILKLKM
jgi:4-amino-4-deoxy-L-arabinose transferase-like glycosyltransferase